MVSVTQLVTFLRDDGDQATAILMPAFGIAALWAGLIQGAGAEAVFAIGRWRNYRWYMLILAAIASGIFAFVYEYFLFSYGALSTGVQLGLFFVRMPSAALLGGLLGKVIGDALGRTGVLRSVAIGKERK